MASIPVLEVGGTHVSAALVDDSGWSVAGEPRRLHLDGHASAEGIIGRFVAAAAQLAEHADLPAGAVWGVAMPDPFDYDKGIGRFHDVGKFDALDGVDVRAALLDQLPGRPGEIVFHNDADCFALGEWVRGSGEGTHRCTGITLGTGVGSGWIADGRVVVPDSPPGGRIHQLTLDGQPLEELMSRRAIVASYAEATGGDGSVDVREIAERARAGEPAAADTLRAALVALGRVTVPIVRAFGADVLVIGGSMSASWDLFEPWFRDGAGDGALPPVRVAQHPDDAPLTGAAYAAVSGR